MHLYKRDANFFGGSGIVGGQIPVGAGLAFKHQYKKDGNVSFTIFGDGAANQGQLYEVLNFSKSFGSRGRERGGGRFACGSDMNIVRNQRI